MDEAGLIGIDETLMPWLRWLYDHSTGVDIFYTWKRTAKI